MNKNFDSYRMNYDTLPFERIQERYRRIELLKILSAESMQDKEILEIGPGERSIGLDMIGENNFTIIEPIKKFADANAALYLSEKPKSRVSIHSILIEDYLGSLPGPIFQYVLMSSNLHEFDDAQGILSILRNKLDDNSKIIIVVPNNESIHRILGVHLGFLDSTLSLTRTELQMQQKRNFSITTLSNLLESCGFRVEKIYTSFVKPWTHAQLQLRIDQKLIEEAELDLLHQLSEVFNPYGSEIFCVASLE
jgi:hypothetical protein